ncbi:hypothetical protein [Vulcanisaeta sp. JCM 14467]|uniref:hypothetical protein n=1 Tax=Vulcanisaeta sp. JCM 14467 TaxID=1295370 RepID=UPI0006CF9B4A|nr:hypothetical protein [Vulcanisaeta sp. JCM 14467]
MDEFIYIIGLLVTIVAYLATFTYWLGRRLESIDWRFQVLEERLSNRIKEVEAKLEGRVSNLENRMSNLESRVGSLESRMSSLESRMNDLENRMDKLENRMNNLENRMNNLENRMINLENRMNNLENRMINLENRMNSLENRMIELGDGLKSAVVNINTLLIEYMGLKGLFTQDEVRVLSNEVSRVISMVRANPISKEELDFIKSVFSKDPEQMSIEELERVIEIAKRWWWQDNSEIAFKVFQVASIIRPISCMGRRNNSSDETTQPSVYGH